MVTKPDRLARSTAELLAIEADLSKRGVGLVVLSMGGERLDTRNATSKLMLTILAGVATWEREIMLERQREGIAKAKAEGAYKGRKPSIDAAKVKALAATMGPAAIAKQLGIARSSVYRMLEQPAADTQHCPARWVPPPRSRLCATPLGRSRLRFGVTLRISAHWRYFPAAPCPGHARPTTRLAPSAR